MVIVVLGLGLASYGVWSVVRPTPVTVEIIRDEQESSGEGEVVVDVGGAIIKAGLYHLPGGSRVGDALVAAGGLAGDTDREWVAESLNLAAILEDGQKIYIPRLGERSKSDGVEAEVKAGLKVNLNKASQNELETLWGIGEARAGEIIAKRPYSSLEEWQNKAQIPQNVFDRVKGEVSVY